MLKEKSGSNLAAWAIDPYEGKIRPNFHEVRNLLNWMEDVGLQIQPIYILNVGISAHSQKSPFLVTETKLAEVEAEMRKYLQELGCPPTLKPKVVVSYDANSGEVVEKLLQQCHEINAEMIIVSSRGRKGLDRFIFGSFAETLLLQSDLPLYFLTHQNGTPSEKRDNKILFPTDFSHHSRLAFESLLKQAKLCGSEIILYHGITTISGGDMIIIPDNYYEEQTEEAKIKGRKWIKFARAGGVKAKLVVQELGYHANIASAIMEAAQNNSTRLIAMASNSGRTASILFGSVANDVFRSNLFPVWLCGPQAVKTGKETFPQEKAAPV